MTEHENEIRNCSCGIDWECCPVRTSSGSGKRRAAQNQTRSMTQTQMTQQLGAVSGTQTGTMGLKTQAGKPYGPGDGTGNQGVGPKDGTGLGAPGNR
jgi:hypothetical protein